MQLTQADIGSVVSYHGPTEHDLPHGWHYRVLEVTDGIRELPDGSRLIGRWAILDDGCGNVQAIRQAMLSPVSGRCICETCCP